jgi:ABC-type Zn uptake system ZnuABC Zn-binding protein ZnuA
MICGVLSPRAAALLLALVVSWPQNVLAAPALDYARPATGPTPAQPAMAPLVVATSQALFADLIRQVVGDRAEIVTVVPPGADPQTYDPTDDDVDAVARAAVFFANGLNLEPFLPGLLQHAANPELRLVVLSNGLKVVGKGGITIAFGAMGNPFLWLNVRNAMAYVETIRETMVAIDPDNAGAYQANAARYLAELKALDQEIQASIATIPAGNRTIVVFPDAFPYYADRYGLEDLAVVAVDPQSDPSDLSSHEYSNLVDQLRAARIKAIFGAVGFSTPLVEQLANDVGATFVPNLYVDTLGGTPETMSYEAIMRWDTRQFVDNLR